MSCPSCRTWHDGYDDCAPDRETERDPYDVDPPASRWDDEPPVEYLVQGVWVTGREP